MIQSPSQKALVRRGILPLLPVMLLAAALPLASVNAQNYAGQLANALPAGSNPSTAPSAAFQGAVQRVIQANSPENAPAIAAAIASSVDIGRAKEVGDAIGKLFPSNPALRQQAPAIAQAIANSIRSRVNASDTALEDQGLAGKEIGDTLSVIVYHLGLNDPENRPLIFEVINAVVAISPDPHITPVIVSTLIANLEKLGAPDSLIEEAIVAINQVVDNPEVVAAIEDSLGRGQKKLFPPGVQPGEILTHETPVTNV